MWRCPQCVAHVEDARTACTTCGTARPETNDPSPNSSDMDDLVLLEEGAVSKLFDPNLRKNLKTIDKGDKLGQRFGLRTLGMVLGGLIGAAIGAFCASTLHNGSDSQTWHMIFTVPFALVFVLVSATLAGMTGGVVFGILDNFLTDLVEMVVQRFRPKHGGLTMPDDPDLARLSPVTRHTSDSP